VIGSPDIVRPVGCEARLKRNRFVESYVTKKSAAEGAEPMVTEPIPRYMLRKPPEAKKPSLDWRRVLRVSRG
jgi:hypothetical protein